MKKKNHFIWKSPKNRNTEGTHLSWILNTLTGSISTAMGQYKYLLFTSSGIDNERLFLSQASLLFWLREFCQWNIQNRFDRLFVWCDRTKCHSFGQIVLMRNKQSNEHFESIFFYNVLFGWRFTFKLSNDTLIRSRRRVSHCIHIWVSSITWAFLFWRIRQQS